MKLNISKWLCSNILDVYFVIVTQNGYIDKHGMFQGDIFFVLDM